jgi:hypothetical protein
MTKAELAAIVDLVQGEWGLGGLEPDTIYGQFAMEVAERALVQDQPKIEEAVMVGKQACSSYMEWYNHGHSHEAWAIAYDLVSAIRNMLASLECERSEG